MSKILCVARVASSMAFFGTLTLLGLLWSGSAAADACKPAGATCNTSQSCCGSGGRTKGVCVKAPGAKFGVCCSPAAGEICDGHDNNCNGQIDENLGATTCGNGSCANTVQNCVNGAPQTCTPVADGTGCDDGDACTQTDTCQAGDCRGSGVVCPFPTPPNDCQIPTCDPQTGCGFTNVPNATRCGPNGERSCVNGVCECLSDGDLCDTAQADACCSRQCCSTDVALGGNPGRCCVSR